MEIKPNIVIINCDDLGYGDLGCFGSKLNHTPNIDYLAENGLRLTDFYMASPVCSPSRGAMLTGCYPPRIGFGSFDGASVLMPGQGIGLSDREETIADVLRRSGYSTAIIGKWHCGDQPEFFPTRHGFDSWYGLPYSNDMGIQKGNKESDSRRCFFPPLPLMDDEQVIEQQPDLAGLTERYTENAVRFIRRNSGKPFFLYFAHMYVHLPLYVQKHFMNKTENGLFGAAVQTVDWSVGMLLYELRKLGIEENTLVIFTSDNGSRGKDEEGCSNKPLRGGKFTTWEGGLRVPCICYWKNRIERRVSGEIISSIDFLPSFTALIGGKTHNEIDGLDASNFLFNNYEYSPRDTFLYYLANDLQAVRKNEYKLFLSRYGKEVFELYNLRDDIGEQINVYGAHPDITANLLIIANRYRERLGDAFTNTIGSEIRPIGRVDNPKTITQYCDNHPYLIAEYDSEASG